MHGAADRCMRLLNPQHETTYLACRIVRAQCGIVDKRFFDEMMKTSSSKGGEAHAALLGGEQEFFAPMKGGGSNNSIHSSSILREDGHNILEEKLYDLKLIESSLDSTKITTAQSLTLRHKVSSSSYESMSQPDRGISLRFRQTRGSNWVSEWSTS